MPINRPKPKNRTGKSALTRGRLSVRRPKAVPKLLPKGRKISEIGEIVRKRAEAEAAIADAARSNARLREARNKNYKAIGFFRGSQRHALAVKNS